MPPTQPPLSEVLPPLIFGTATFNYQYNKDPENLPTTALVHRAFADGVRAFDTSPYYGPAEEILGKALVAPYESTGAPYPRSAYHIVTKVGRNGASSFDYSAHWVRKSIARSLERLHTTYLDVVYCHDVEFVTPAEVLTAVKELRRLRDEEHTIRYVGISGYPIDVLAELSELVLKETGEPVDCVMSYANYTLQNRRLKTRGIERFVKAGVKVVPNASILGMGLLRRGGLPVGGLGNWHPAPDGLKEAVKKASEYCNEHGEKIEVVAIRWSLESWLTEGAPVGSSGDPTCGLDLKGQAFKPQVVHADSPKIGVSVMGVSTIEELEETITVWRSILAGLEQSSTKVAHVAETGSSLEEVEWSLKRKGEIVSLADGIWDILGPEWTDFAWPSPGEDYVRETTTG